MAVDEEADKKGSDKKKGLRFIITDPTPDNMALEWLYCPKVRHWWWGGIRAQVTLLMKMMKS